MDFNVFTSLRAHLSLFYKGRRKGMNTIITGDEHIRSEEPFYSAKRDYFDWFIKQDFNNKENMLINTGDFFHSKSPTPKDYELAHWYLKQCQFNKIYILRGNGAHEFNVTRKTYATYPLEQFENVEIIKTPTIIYNGDTSFLLLPFIPSWELDGQTLNEYYQEYIEKLVAEEMDTFDYIIGHFFHKNGFGDDIDISPLKGKRRMGHNHVPSKDGEYVGINTITRSDEAGCDLHFNKIDGNTKKEELIEIPRFLDYASIDYEKDDLLQESVSRYTLYNVTNAPDEKSIYQKYGNIIINKWDRKKQITEDTGGADEDGEAETLLDYFENFMKKKKVNTNLKNKLKTLVKEKE